MVIEFVVDSLRFVSGVFDFVMSSSTDIMIDGIVVEGKEVVVVIVVLASNSSILGCTVSKTVEDVAIDVEVGFAVVGCVLEKVTPLSSRNDLIGVR